MYIFSVSCYWVHSAFLCDRISQSQDMARLFVFLNHGFLLIVVNRVINIFVLLWRVTLFWFIHSFFVFIPLVKNKSGEDIRHSTSSDWDQY